MSALTSAQWKDHWVVYGNLCVTLVPDRPGKGQRYSLRIYVFRGSLRIIWPSSDLVFLDSFIHSFIHSFPPRITYCVPSLCQSLCGTLGDRVMNKIHIDFTLTRGLGSPFLMLRKGPHRRTGLSPPLPECMDAGVQCLPQLLG